MNISNALRSCEMTALILGPKGTLRQQRIGGVSTDRAAQGRAERALLSRADIGARIRHTVTTAGAYRFRLLYFWHALDLPKNWKAFRSWYVEVFQKAPPGQSVDLGVDLTIAERAWMAWK